MGGNQSLPEGLIAGISKLAGEYGEENLVEAITLARFKPGVFVAGVQRAQQRISQYSFQGSPDFIQLQLVHKFGPEVSLGAAQRAFNATAGREYEFVTHMRNKGISLVDAVRKYGVPIQFLRSLADENRIPHFWKEDDRGESTLLYFEEAAVERAVALYNPVKEQGQNA